MGRGALRAGIDLEDAGHGSSSQLNGGALEANRVGCSALVLTHVGIAHLLKDQHVLDPTHVAIQGVTAGTQLRLMAADVGAVLNGHTVMEPLQRRHWRCLHNALQLCPISNLGINHSLWQRQLWSN